MTDRLLTDSFELSGEWYLPESPDLQIAGRLKYTPDRTELQLRSAFLPLKANLSNPLWTRYPIVHGVAEQGELISIFHAQRTELNVIGGGRQTERVISDCIMIGAHVSGENCFHEMRFRIPGLPVWLARVNVLQELKSKDESHSVSSLSFNIECKQAELIAVPAIDATLEWGIEYRPGIKVYTSFSILIEAWVKIIPRSCRSLDWFFEQQRKVEAMLTFLAGTPMSTDCILASVEESAQQVNVLVMTRNLRPCQFENLHDFFMPRNAMGKSLENVVTTWFEKVSEVLTPSQLAISVLSSTDLWLHVEFLSLMQALEGYHRSYHSGFYMEEDQYQVVRKSLTEAIPQTVHSDHRKALLSKIKYGNQVSLHKRLDELVASITKPLMEKILGGTTKVPRSWIDTRNYHTHWDEDLRSNVLEGQDMYDANVRLQHLLRVIYLRLMGIPDDAILKSLSGTSIQSQQLIQMNATNRRKSTSSE